MFARSLSRPAVFAVGAASLAIASGAYGACTGPGAPSTTQTKCLTAVLIPGAPMRCLRRVRRGRACSTEEDA